MWSGRRAAVDSEIALFDGVTGKLVKRATGTGPVKVASGVLSAAAIDLSGSEVTGDASCSATLDAAEDGAVTVVFDAAARSSRRGSRPSSHAVCLHDHGGALLSPMRR